jgi:hypothetical protein
MTRVYFACLFPCLAAAFLLSPATPAPVIDRTAKAASSLGAPPADPKDQARILDSYGKLPLSFEANRGQSDGRVRFLSRNGGYTLFLTQDEAVLALRGSRANTPEMKSAGAAHTLRSGLASPTASALLRMKLRNANPAAKVTGVDELAGTSNYFIGNDPAKWRSNVPTYAKVKYEGIYSGIDLVYYGNQRQLEYDFIVAPGADPHRIAFEVSGAQSIRRDPQGDLVLKMPEGEIRWHKPVVYQEKDGAKQEIAARYAIAETNRVGFEVAGYDASRPLYIDPLIYSTYLGGSGHDLGAGVAVDSAGNAYIVGSTNSADFPTTPGAFQTVCNGGSGCATNWDAFVAKINAAGSALVYSTYLGGSGIDESSSIAVDTAGNAYVTGDTGSADFPLMNPLQPTFHGGEVDAFVTKINPVGSALVYSTYLGGSGQDLGLGIAVDSAGNAYVTGVTGSANFPTTPGAFQTVCNGSGSGCGTPSRDAFVSKINPSGSGLVYSTYLGGSGDDDGNSIALDGAGNAYVTGLTGSTNFPTMNPLQPNNAGTAPNCPCNAFVSKINPSGSGLVYSTYLGGSVEEGGIGIAVDSLDNAYITGFTLSTDFPTINALQPTFGGGFSDGFVSKINAAGSALVYSSYLGGNSYDNGSGIAVDGAGNAYVTGETCSTDFPTMNALQPTYGGGDCNGGGDAFVSKLNPVGSALVYSTYLGGSGDDNGSSIAVDTARSAYVVGTTLSADFPAINPLQPLNAGGGGDAFLAKITADLTLTPQVLNFGRQLVGTTSTPKISKLTNTGSATLTITSISLSGADIGDFVETNNCGTSIAVGGSCTFTVTFTPAALGSRSAGVTINDSALDSPHTVGLTGVGTYSTTTNLTSAPNPSGLGRPVTLTAVVVPGHSGTPTGTVTFYDGAGALGTVALSSGESVLNTSKLSMGSHSLTAAYNGDATFDPSTSPVVTQRVETATTATLASSLNPSTYGQTVTFTATVNSNIGAPPNGETVTFKQGSTVLGTGTLSGGLASFSTSTLPAGTDSITAVYAGDSTFAGSTSKAVSQVVNKATTTTALISSQNPSSFNQSVTFTATVSAEFSGTPTGSVTFKNGTTTLKTVTLSGGVAKLTTTTLAVGTESITAVYNGNSSLLTSTSGALSQVVNQASTTATLASSLNPSNFGQSVTFTAKVSAQFGGTVTGTVTFMDGTTSLATVNLGSGVARFTTSTLAKGTHNITATYNGSTDFSTSSAELTQTVN